MAKVDLLVKNGEVWTPGGFVGADIAVSDGKVVALGKPPVMPDSADVVIDAKGNAQLRSGALPFASIKATIDAALATK